MLSTLLGSCVAVCLYDPVVHVMGMNHFLLANPRYDRNKPVIESEAGRYGLQSMELLINGLLQQGALRHRLQAKAFGGGNVVQSLSGADSFFAVGSVNVRFVREFLHNESIPLLAMDLGGDYGRQIHFDGSDYSVYMRKISTSQTLSIEREEKRHWRKSLAEHQREKEQPKVEFW